MQATNFDLWCIVELFGHQSPRDLHALQNKIRAQEKSIELLLDRFVQGHVTPEDYNNTRGRYESNLHELKSNLELITIQEKEWESDLAASLDLITNIAQWYSQAEPEVRPAFLGSILPGKLYYAKNECRTSGFSPFIELLSNSGKGFNTIKKIGTSDFSPLVPSGSPSATPSRTFSDSNIIRLDIQQLSGTLKMLRA